MVASQLAAPEQGSATSAFAGEQTLPVLDNLSSQAVYHKATEIIDEARRQTAVERASHEATEAWESLRPEFDKLLPAYMAAMEPHFNESIFESPETVKDNVAIKDEMYFKKGLTAILTLAYSTTGRVLGLFDVDGTIGELVRPGKPGDNEYNIVRPAFELLIKAAAERVPDNRFIAGLLTTKDQISINDQLTHPTYFEAAVRAGVASPEFIISSTDVEKGDPVLRDLMSSNEPNIAIKKALAGRVIDNKYFEAGYSESHAVPFDTKFAIIEGLLSQNPALSIAFMDDLPVLEATSKDHPRFIAVCVCDEQQSDWPVMVGRPPYRSHLAVA